MMKLRKGLLQLATIRAILGALLTAVLLCGCEDVVKMGLKTTAPRLVIEGILSNKPDLNYFNITRSTDFYQPNDVEQLTGATVVIVDNVGNVDTLRESEPGHYRPRRFLRPRAGRTYQARVQIDGQIFTASSMMQPVITIDSLRARYQKGGGIGDEEKAGYRLGIFFDDMHGRADYVRVTMANGSTPSPEFHLYNGHYTDGSTIFLGYFEELFQHGDTARIVLYSCEKSSFDYFLNLSKDWASKEGGHAFDATPANPTSNWSGDALGYFGVFSVDWYTGIFDK